MRYVVTLMCAAVFVLAAQAQEAPVQEQAHGPKLVVDETTFNFGEVENERDVEHTFILRNEGDMTLEISSTRASCGCTVTRLSANAVPPGGQVELLTRLNLRGRTGHQKKSITVQSNDPANPRLVLYLEGTAMARFRVDPPHLPFGTISSVEEAVRTVDLDSRLQAFQIRNIECSSPAFTTRVETVAGGSHYRVHVTTVPPLEAGPVRANLRIATDLPNFPDINVPISAVVSGAVMFAPREIVLSAAGDAPVKRYVIVRPGSVRSFSIEGVEPPDPAMQVTVNRIGGPAGSDETTYQVEIDQISATPALNGKPILIRTNVEGMREISVPFRIVGIN